MEVLRQLVAIGGIDRELADIDPSKPGVELNFILDYVDIGPVEGLFTRLVHATEAHLEHVENLAHS